jgi:hypothetical protein
VSGRSLEKVYGRFGEVLAASTISQDSHLQTFGLNVSSNYASRTKVLLNAAVKYNIF